MALDLYLDDCANSNLLAHLLRQARHRVVRPVEAGDDFHLLHDQNPNHPGIFGIYQDKDVTKDMTDADMVAAIGRIKASVPHGYPIAGEFHVTRSLVKRPLRATNEKIRKRGLSQGG